MKMRGHPLPFADGRIELALLLTGIFVISGAVLLYTTNALWKKA